MRAMAGRRDMRRLSNVLAVAVAIGLATGGLSWAADPRYPDWPCVQAKVPEISVAAVWDGPPLDNAAQAWESDQRVRDLIPRLAQRRVPIEETQKIIADFVIGNAEEREQKGTLLFAG